MRLIFGSCKKVNYAISSNIYKNVENDLSNIEFKNLANRIKEKELPQGGLSANIENVGTPRETLMALRVLQLSNGYKKDNEINEKLKEILNDYINGIKNDDNSQIYSTISSLMLSGEKIDKQQDLIVNKMKNDLHENLTLENFRDWYYAIKILDLLGYKFNSNEMPQNYYSLLSNLNNGYLNFDKEQNGIYTALFVDAISSINPNDENLKSFKTILERMSKTPKDEKFVLHKRYYAIIALAKIEKLSPTIFDDTITILKGLKKDGAFKEDFNAEKVDLRSTFEALTLISMKEGKVNVYY